MEENRLQYMSRGYFHLRFPNGDPTLDVLNNRVDIVILNGCKTESVDGILELFGEKIRSNKTDFEPPRR